MDLCGRHAIPVSPLTATNTNTTTTTAAASADTPTVARTWHRDPNFLQHTRKTISIVLSIGWQLEWVAMTIPIPGIHRGAPGQLQRSLIPPLAQITQQFLERAQRDVCCGFQLRCVGLFEAEAIHTCPSNLVDLYRRQGDE